MRILGHIIGGLAVGLFVIAALPVIALWLIAAFLLDVADGGLFA